MIKTEQSTDASVNNAVSASAKAVVKQESGTMAVDDKHVKVRDVVNTT